jgi:hypothetical protein
LSRNDDVQATALPQGDCWQGSGRYNQSHGSCAQPESLGQEGWPLASDLASSWVEFAPVVNNMTACMEKTSSSGRQGGVVEVLLHLHTHAWLRRLQAKDTYLARLAKPTSVGVTVLKRRTWSNTCGRQQ